MKLDSKYFDRIRVKPSQDSILRGRVPPCEWLGCARPGPYRAPKGRDREGEFHSFCLDHVQQYNKGYNYFDGMRDDAIRGFQKEAMTGHRPTWKLGENAASMNGARRARLPPEGLRDGFGLFGDGARARARTTEKPRRAIRNAELKALQTLGLDEMATPAKAKNQYKVLVKRLHPDANGGSRANEDTLKAVIQAYDYLRSTGFC